MSDQREIDDYDFWFKKSLPNRRPRQAERSLVEQVSTLKDALERTQCLYQQTKMELEKKTREYSNLEWSIWSSSSKDKSQLLKYAVENKTLKEKIRYLEEKNWELEVYIFNKSVGFNQPNKSPSFDFERKIETDLNTAWPESTATTTDEQFLELFPNVEFNKIPHTHEHSDADETPKCDELYATSQREKSTEENVESSDKQ